MPQIKKTVLLIILDGLGLAPASAGNAVRRAEMPFLNKLITLYPTFSLRASGEAVGLNYNEPGNSEVGHLNLGAGKIVWQDLPKIDHSIATGDFFKNKVYPLDVIYRGKEKISVAAGTFNCFILEPLVVEGGLFKNDGSIIIWLSNDELKIPVKVKTKVLIGSIDAELTDYEGLKGKITSKIK